jgi:photosystem II PsbY protein
MDIDLRPLIVLAPIVLVAGWAAFNIIRAAIRGEAKLFGARGNNPFAPENRK